MSDAELLAAARLNGLVVHEFQKELSPEELAAVAQAMETFRTIHGDDEQTFRSTFSEWCKEQGI